MLQSTFNGNVIAKNVNAFTRKVNSLIGQLEKIDELPNKKEILYIIKQAHKKGCENIAQGMVNPAPVDHSAMLQEFAQINPHLSDDVQS